jgi:hypothetical protein
MAIKISGTSGTTVIDDNRELLNINSLSTSDWANGTSSTETVVSPTQIKVAAIEVLIGYNQTWTDVLGSRTYDTWHRNTTGKPIMVTIRGNSSNSVLVRDETFNLSSQIQLTEITGTSTLFDSVSFIVPKLHYYNITAGNGDLDFWAELS